MFIQNVYIQNTHNAPKPQLTSVKKSTHMKTLTCIKKFHTWTEDSLWNEQQQQKRDSIKACQNLDWKKSYLMPLIDNLLVDFPHR